jgi:regulator of protease activity HflC (stomatin/prohibitin superfamily)
MSGRTSLKIVILAVLLVSLLALSLLIWREGEAGIVAPLLTGLPLP